jgi:rod shape-determining protein MreD
VKYVLAALAAWFLAVLNVSVMPYIEVLGVTPHLTLIFAACWAVVRGEDEALFVVPLAAILTDLTSSDPVGTSLLAFAPLVPLAGLARTQAIDSDFLPSAAVVAVGSLAYGIIYVAVMLLVGHSVDLGYALIHFVLPAAVVNALFTPIVYLPIRWLSTESRSVLRGTGRLTSPL